MQAKTPTYKCFCEQCDQELPKDEQRRPRGWVVASMVREEHLEEHPGHDVELEEVDDEWDVDDTAAQIVAENARRHGHGYRGNHCPYCLAFISSNWPAKCGRCGRLVRTRDARSESA